MGGEEGRRGEGEGDVRWCLLMRFCALEFGWWSLLLTDDEEDGGNPFNTGVSPPLYRAVLSYSPQIGDTCFIFCIALFTPYYHFLTTKEAEICLTV